jgi:hypothetical protein
MFLYSFKNIKGQIFQDKKCSELWFVKRILFITFGHIFNAVTSGMTDRSVIYTGS